MKEIVAKIFGKEVAEDEEIVAFYESVQKIAIMEYAHKYHKQRVENNDLLKGVISCDIKLKNMGNKTVEDFITENHDKITGRLVGCLKRREREYSFYSQEERDKQKRYFIYMKDVNKRAFLRAEKNGPSGWRDLEKILNEL